MRKRSCLLVALLAVGVLLILLVGAVVWYGHAEVNRLTKMFELAI
jgi:hypothetical protein